MRNKMIENIPIYVFFLHCAKPQYNPPVYDIMQGYQYPFQNVRYPQYTNHRKYKSYENNKWMQENYDDYNDYTEESNCACDKCLETITKPSCKDVCPNCFNTPPPLIAPSYVFLPFPYPYPVTQNTTIAPVTQTIENTTPPTIMHIITTTATESTKEIETKTDKPKASEAGKVLNILPEENNEIIRNKLTEKDKGHFTLTAIRRTKPNWLPKYGIVPISDKFAEKLMLQLRNMKVLHP